MGHSILSPSSADRWMVCPGSVRLSQGYPNKSSRYAAEGTAAHEIAAWCLTQDRRPTERLGDVLHFDGYEIRVDSEMVEAVEVYVDNVAQYRAPDSELFVEQQLDISWYTQEAGDVGTSDCVIIDLPGRELQVHDLKYGKGVLVEAENNRQMMIYALAAVRSFFDLLGLDDSMFDIVRLVIHQPRASKAPVEWDLTMERLREFEKELLEQAFIALNMLVVTEQAAADSCVPTEKGCKFCPAKAECPALLSLAEQAVDATATADDFDVVEPACIRDAIAGVSASANDKLGRLLPVLGLIEDWCSAVRTAAYERAMSGQQIPGFKLVAGRPGSRKWADAEEAEKVIRSFRLPVDDIYEKTLISPTKAEKLIAKESPRRWEKLQPLIARDDGKPKLVPESAKGEPIVIDPAAAFDAVPADTAGSDLA